LFPARRCLQERRQEIMNQIKQQYQGMIMIDYTQPYTVEDNARFYADNGMPFIMGTTGGPNDRVVEIAEAAGVYAVVAPQMGKQVRGWRAHDPVLPSPGDAVSARWHLRACQRVARRGEVRLLGGWVSDWARMRLRC
jgi:hypothetical protein